MRVVCCDGTWMAPSGVHVQTTGAWKESEMAQDPGGPCQSVAVKRQRWWRSRCPPSRLKVEARFPQGGQRKAKIWHGTENAAQRGCRKATRGAGNRPGGLTGPPWLRSRRPRTRRTSPARCRRGHQCWRVVRDGDLGTRLPVSPSSSTPPEPQDLRSNSNAVKIGQKALRTQCRPVGLWSGRGPQSWCPCRSTFAVARTITWLAS